MSVCLIMRVLDRKNHFLDVFLEPRSVAVIGASKKTGKGSFNVLETLLTFGYRGKVYPVNPQAAEILNLKVYRDVPCLPEGVELALIATPRETVPEIVAACAAKGIRGAIIITEGFGEADERGQQLQSKISAVIGETGMRILGPNSVGVVNSFQPFTSAFIPLPKNVAPVALISQSGGFFEGFPECPVGKGIDLGNTSDIDFVDTISYFEKDEDIRVIVLHMEGIARIHEFMYTCRRAVKTKPIIVLKGGRSASGSKAAASHTGSLSGKNELYRTMFKQARVMEADSIAGIGDFTKAFLSLPPFIGNRVAIITPTGAGGIITLDAVEKHGFQAATLSQETIDEIARLFQSWIKVRNPLDILSAGMMHGYKQVYARVLGACLKDQNVDSVVALCGAYTLKTIMPVAAMYPHKPLILWIMGADRSLINERGQAYDFAPYYRSPDRALYALKMVREYYRQKATEND